ncbi:HEAT repeat domain-containing protein [Thiobacillus sp.]
MLATTPTDIHSRLDHTDPEVRRIAVMDLLDSDEDDVDQLLLGALKDDDAKVRAEAARLLEGYETPEVVGGLIRVLADDSEEVREAAAVSLSELKDAAMGDGLLAALSVAPQPFVQAALFRALRELRRPEAFVPALAALASDDTGVRCAALGVLGYLKNPDALPDIARIAGSDPDLDARRIAVGALGFATELAAVVPAMKRALVDTSWQVREEAAATLGKLRAADAIDDLIAAMADPYWQVRLKAARSLGRLKAKSALPALIAALGHEMSNLRKEAAVALGEVGEVAAIPALEKALDDSDPDVRKLARLALNQLSK